MADPQAARAHARCVASAFVSASGLAKTFAGNVVGRSVRGRGDLYRRVPLRMPRSKPISFIAIWPAVVVPRERCRQRAPFFARTKMVSASYSAVAYASSRGTRQKPPPT